MKTLNFLAPMLLGACGTSAPATPEPAPVEQVTCVSTCGVIVHGYSCEEWAQAETALLRSYSGRFYPRGDSFVPTEAQVCAALNGVTFRLADELEGGEAFGWYYYGPREVVVLAGPLNRAVVAHEVGHALDHVMGCGTWTEDVHHDWSARGFDWATSVYLTLVK